MAGGGGRRSEDPCFLDGLSFVVRFLSCEYELFVLFRSSILFVLVDGTDGALQQKKAMEIKNGMCSDRHSVAISRLDKKWQSKNAQEVLLRGGRCRIGCTFIK